MIVIFYQQDSNLYAPAHKVSVAHNCSPHKKIMLLQVSKALWQVLTHSTCHSHSPIPTKTYAFKHRMICNSQKVPHSSLSLGFCTLCTFWSVQPCHHFFPSQPPPHLARKLTYSLRPRLWIMFLSNAFLTLHTLTRENWTFLLYHLCAWYVPLNT